MKKQRLIPMIIVFIMIMNCLLPVLPVKAATSKAIILNGELYNAVKEELIEQKITASYNDSQRRIVITEAELSKVTSMDLSNRKISDILGLENFTNIVSLDLSGNELTSESNLDVLSTLKLEFLDISANKIEDVSMITNFSEISEINLHGQIISTVEVISLDTSSDSDHKARYTIKLPQILSLEEINADWLDVGINDNSDLKPIWTSLSRDENNIPTLTLDVAHYDGNNEEYIIHDGAIEITINIGDTDTELEDTSISLFYVVINNEQRAAIFKDDNFYNVVKKQLTHGENDINEDLRTYKDGENGETLYEKVYDEAKVMVFDFNTLINEIPTLKASNYKISDICGIETFVGLEDMIDLSYNYIDSIDGILKLQENKVVETERLQAKFTKQVNEVIKPIREKLVEHLNAIEVLDEQIEKLQAQIEALQKAISELEGKLLTATEEEAKKIKDEISTKKSGIDKIEDMLKPEGDKDENGDYIPSLPEIKEEEIINADEYLLMLKPQMEKLYQIYNKEYKATTLLTTELYDISSEDFNYLRKDEAKAILNSLIAKIEKLESSKSLSKYEEMLLKEEFTGIREEDISGNKIVNPISTYLKSEITRVEEIASAGTYKNYIASIMAIDASSQVLYNSALVCLNYEADIDKLTNADVEKILRKVCEVFIEDAGEKVALAYEEILVQINDENIEDMREYYSETIKFENLITVDVKKGTHEEFSLKQILGLSGKFVNLSQEEIKRWITLPDVKKLNLQNNMIEDIDGIENLIKLEELNVSENEIVNVSEIDWAKLTELKILDLHFNFISEISELANIKNLEVLNVANNLLSGEFNLNIANMTKLVEADFSENAYTDINPLIQQFRLKAKDEGMDVGDYILSKVDIKLYNQNININLDEKILVGSGDSQIIREVKLPPIIKQFEDIDSTRTVFGTQSIYGKISADGKVGLIISKEEGNHSGLVSVETKTDSDTLSVGHGTVCKINYVVTSATVKDVLITMNRENVIRGGKTQFEAHVDAVNVWDTSVTWSVEGKTSNDTKINENGLLIVGEDETAEKLTVRATSNYDNSKYLDMKVNVVDADVKVILKTSPNTKGIEAGTSKVYEAEVITDADNKEVSWSISGNTSENTVINNEGLLKVGKDEAHGAKITVKAISEYNNEEYDYIVEVVTVGEEIPEDPGDTTEPVEPNPGDTTEPIEPNPGDTTDPVEPNPGDTTEPVEEKIEVKYNTKEEMLYVEKPNTTIADFVKGLVDGEHTITVSDGKGNKITDYTKVVITGMVVAIGDSIENTYEIVVVGDVNGDGQVDSIDSNFVKAHRVETNKLEGANFEAADINKDGKVNKIDSFLLLFFRASKISDFSESTIEAVMK